MSLSSPQLSLPYFVDLCSSKLHSASLIDILSELETSAQLDATTTPSVSQLLSTYYSVYLLTLLLDEDLNEARFLLQRIPAPLLADPQLDNAAALLRALYTRNYLAVYVALSSPNWATALVPLKDRFQAHFRKNTFLLLSKAYSSISPASAAAYLGLNTSGDESVRKLIDEGWEYDLGSGLLKPSVRYESNAGGLNQKDERIGRLTALVTHLTEV